MSRFLDRMARVDARLVARLGDDALLTDGTRVKGTFSAPFLGSQLGARQGRTGAPLNTDRVLEPTFTLPAATASQLAKGDTVTIDIAPALGGGRYQVVNLKPDGNGLVAVVLAAERERGDDIT